MVRSMFTKRRPGTGGAGLEAFDDQHGAGLAGGAGPEGVGGVRVVLGLRVRRGGRGHAEQAPAQVEVPPAAGSGQQPEMADAVEARRQDVQQESADAIPRTE